MKQNRCCFHCRIQFNAKEGRRNFGKRQGDVDIIQILSLLYDFAENTLRDYVDSLDYDCIVWNKFFNAIKGIYRNKTRLDNLVDTLKTSVSVKFLNLNIQLSPDTLINTNQICVPPQLSIHSPSKGNRKRPRSCFTPIRSGHTPKEKKTPAPFIQKQTED